MKLLSPTQVAEVTGLPYAKALTVIKSLAYTRIDHNYYINESKLKAFLLQEDAVELRSTKEEEMIHGYRKHSKKKA